MTIHERKLTIRDMTVGVLAFQGDFAEHEEVLRSMNVKTVQVRTLANLSRADRLIIPGGESTVMAKFLDDTGVGEEIQRRVSSGSLGVFGTCAGAILLARKVLGRNAPKTLNLIDVDISRNAYGSQKQSFEALVKLTGSNDPCPGSFIRAPKFARVGRDVTILARVGNDPVLVCHGRILASAFHPEVRGNSRIHKLFLKM